MKKPIPDNRSAFEVVDFGDLDPVPCPCGLARRGLADVPDFPGTIHVTQISQDARLHYHKQLIETYYFLDCDPNAQIQLNDQLLAVHRGLCIMICAGTRHRVVGRATVLIVVFPKFDPNDEWFD